MDAAAGTIFDSAWFAPERPAFKAIAQWGDATTTLALIAVALFIVFIAVNPKTPPVAKAILFSWIILP